MGWYVLCPRRLLHSPVPNFLQLNSESELQLQPPAWSSSRLRRKKTVSYSNNVATGGGPTHECNNNKFYLAGSTIKLFLFFFFFQTPPVIFLHETAASLKGFPMSAFTWRSRKRSHGGEQRFALSSLHKCKRGVESCGAQGGYLFTLSVVIRRLKLPLGSVQTQAGGQREHLLIALPWWFLSNKLSEMRFESSGDFRCIIALPQTLNLEFIAKMDVKFVDGAVGTTNKKKKRKERKEGF